MSTTFYISAFYFCILKSVANFTCTEIESLIPIIYCLFRYETTNCSMDICPHKNCVYSKFLKLFKHL